MGELPEVACDMFIILLLRIQKEHEVLLCYHVLLYFHLFHLDAAISIDHLQKYSVWMFLSLNQPNVLPQGALQRSLFGGGKPP